ncbi:MAG: hypothetical protein HY820_02915 [Acidobacteria bacterium]|nr:hypothetical protein [Acidobacteriota bacterium]
MKRALGALRYLTVLPVKGAPPGECAALFPLFAAGLGWVAGWLLARCAQWVGAYAGAAVVVAAWAAVQGGRGERGTAMVFWKWTAALAVVVRWHALTRLATVGPGVVAACAAVAYASMVVQAYVARPVDNAGSDSLPARLSQASTITAAVLGVALVWLAGFPRAIVILCVAAFLAQVLVRWFDSRDGGMSGSASWASGWLVETVGLAVASQV